MLFPPGSLGRDPIAAEQPGIAARIAHLGTGTVVPLQTLTAEKLSAAIDTVLRDASYRDAAQEAAISIRALRPAAEAFRLIKQVLL